MRGQLVPIRPYTTKMVSDDGAGKAGLAAVILSPMRDRAGSLAGQGRVLARPVPPLSPGCPAPPLRVHRGEPDSASYPLSSCINAKPVADLLTAPDSPGLRGAGSGRIRKQDATSSRPPVCPPPSSALASSPSPGI